MRLPIEVDLSNKVVAITGGSGVIGSEMSRALARSGAKVAIISLNNNAEQLLEEIRSNGGTVDIFQGDVTDKSSMEAVRQDIHRLFGTVDILINGAGGNAPGGTTEDERYNPNGDTTLKNFFSLDEKEVEFVFDLNFLGTFIPTQVFAQDMVNKETASIVNISSMNAFKPLTKIPAYSSAKSAVSNFTEWLSTYFSKTNIRVNAIAPGFLLTQQNEALLLDKDGNYTERSKKILAATPMGRFGEPRELIGALLFLIYAPASSFVNGVVLPVDGGFNAYSGV